MSSNQDRHHRSRASHTNRSEQVPFTGSHYTSGSQQQFQGTTPTYTQQGTQKSTFQQPNYSTGGYNQPDYRQPQPAFQQPQPTFQQRHPDHQQAPLIFQQRHAPPPGYQPALGNNAYGPGRAQTSDGARYSASANPNSTYAAQYPANANQNATPRANTFPQSAESQFRYEGPVQNPTPGAPLPSARHSFFDEPREMAPRRGERGSDRDWFDSPKGGSLRDRDQERLRRGNSLADVDFRDLEPSRSKKHSDSRRKGTGESHRSKESGWHSPRRSRTEESQRFRRSASSNDPRLDKNAKRTNDGQSSYSKSKDDHYAQSRAPTSDRASERSRSGPHEAKDVSIDDISDALDVSKRMTDKCIKGARAFGRSMPDADVNRIQSAFDTKEFVDWREESGGSTLIILEHPGSRRSAATSSKDGSFSLLSPFLCAALNDMSNYDMLCLTFFCGHWGANSYGAGAIDTAILQAFCSQLLNNESDLGFQPKDLEFTNADLRELDSFGLAAVKRLFKRLLVALPRYRNTLVCFIDGAHVIEEAEQGFERLKDLLEFCRACVKEARATGLFELKILLTVPKKSNTPWKRLEDGRVVTLSLTQSDSQH